MKNIIHPSVHCILKTFPAIDAFYGVHVRGVELDPAKGGVAIRL
jgi:hypothetical protein